MPSSPTVVKIDRRFNGPPDSANGGITCGLLAGAVGGGVQQVRLSKPPPLDVDLRLHDGCLYDGEVLIASAQAGSVDVVPPPAVSVSAASEAALGYAGFEDHPFPTCFVCGPARDDGLGLYAGPIGDVVAAAWTPSESAALMVWAALDCPGGWSALLPGRPLVLGQMACRIDALPAMGEPHVVQGWMLGSEGRKVWTGSALYSASGEVLAVAQATWIAVTSPAG